MHWNSRITLCLILLYCCVPIQSHPRGLPHVLFLLLYVAVFAYTAHSLCIAVSSVHVTIICTQIRHSGNIRNFGIPCIISHQHLWIVYIRIYEREFEPGWSVLFLFFLDLPSFRQFCWLALSGFISDPVFMNPLLQYNAAQNSQYYVTPKSLSPQF